MPWDKNCRLDLWEPTSSLVCYSVYGSVDRMCELCFLPGAMSMVPFTPAAWGAAFIEVRLFPGPFISCGLVAQVERWIHGSDQTAGKNSAEAGQEKLLLKKPTLRLLILHNTAATDLCQGSATAARAQITLSMGAFQVNGLCYSVNNYPHVGSIFDWVLSDSSVKRAFDFDSSGNRARTGARERYFPCTSSLRKYILLYSLYLVWFAALGYSVAIRWLETYH